MAKYLISMHPKGDWIENSITQTEVYNMTKEGEDYFVERDVALLSDKSSNKECVDAFGRLLMQHYSEYKRKLEAGLQVYSNPFDFFKGEAERKKNRAMKYAANITAAHTRIDALNSRIVMELSRKDKMRNTFFFLLFGIIILGLAIFSSTSGGAVKVLTALINSEWLFAIFVLVVLGLSLAFGFFAIGIVLVGVLVLLAWLVLEVPVVVSVIANGLLFIISVVLLILAISELKETIKYKPMTDEEREKNQKLIAEKEKLCEELAEYSDVMLAGINVIKNALRFSEKAFLEHLNQKYIKYHNADAGWVYSTLAYLTKYYSKMKR